MSGPFDVVFRGEIDDKFSKNTVQESLKKAIGTNDERIKRLFSGKAIYLKKDVNQEEASNVCSQLAKLGAIAKVEPSLRRTSGENEVDLNKIAPALKLLDIETQSPNQTAAPQVVIVERAAPEPPAPSERNSLSFIISCISGFFWLIVGLWFVASFSPFGDGTLKRGAVLGLLLCLFGCYRIINRNKVR